MIGIENFIDLCSQSAENSSNGSEINNLLNHRGWAPTSNPHYSYADFNSPIVFKVSALEYVCINSN